MWRTGSSYLLSRFEAEPRYLPFYEPFNGELSDRVLRRRAKASYDTRHVDLNHPASETDYFAVFDRADPATGKPLWTFSRPRLPIADVYSGLSDDGIRLIEASLRLAEAESRRAVFGFCHSGVQIAAMKRRFGGDHVYLARAPRDQFWSYRPLTNDFFVPATVLQLLAAPQWRATALALVPQLRARSSLWNAGLARSLPHRLAMRIGRWMAAGIPVEDMYALFYLSWKISNGAGQADCDLVVTLKALSESPQERAEFEARFAIELANLAPPDVKPGDAIIDFGEVESRVDAALNRG